MTWNTQPAAGGTLYGTNLSDGNIGSFIFLDLTGLVQDWYDGSFSNNGLRLTTIETQTSLMGFKGYDDGIVGNWPTLIVEFVSAIGPTGPTGPTGVTGATGAIGATGAAGPNLLVTHAYLSRKGIAPVAFTAGTKIGFTTAVLSGGITFDGLGDITLPAGTYEITYYAFAITPPGSTASLQLFDGISAIADSEYAPVNVTVPYSGVLYGQIIVTFGSTTTISLRVSPGSAPITIPPTFPISVTTVSASILIKRLV